MSGEKYIPIAKQGTCADFYGTGAFKDLIMQADTVETCAKEVEKLRWLGMIAETDYLFMFTFDQATSFSECKICSMQLGETGVRSKEIAGAKLYAIT
jgi:hypothetical protein